MVPPLWLLYYVVFKLIHDSAPITGAFTCSFSFAALIIFVNGVSKNDPKG